MSSLSKCELTTQRMRELCDALLTDNDDTDAETALLALGRGGAPNPKRVAFYVRDGTIWLVAVTPQEEVETLTILEPADADDWIENLYSAWTVADEHPETEEIIRLTDGGLSLTVIEEWLLLLEPRAGGAWPVASFDDNLVGDWISALDTARARAREQSEAD